MISRRFFDENWICVFLRVGKRAGIKKLLADWSLDFIRILDFLQILDFA